MQVDLVTELEEKLPPVRLYFFKKFHTLKKQRSRMFQLTSYQSATFNDKVKAIKDSVKNNSNMIEEHQVTSQLCIYN